LTPSKVPAFKNLGELGETLQTTLFSPTAHPRVYDNKSPIVQPNHFDVTKWCGIASASWQMVGGYLEVINTPPDGMSHKPQDKPGTLQIS